MENFSFMRWTRKELGFVGSVLAVVFILSFIQIKIGQMKTRDAQRKADTELVARAIWKYHDANLIFPPSVDGKILACGGKSDQVCDWGGGPLRDLERIFLNKIPQDPFTTKGRSYVYKTDAARENFRVYAAIEAPRDPGKRTGLTMECGKGLQCNWYAQ